jgi:HD superfamily phosphohydrolase
MVLTLSKQLDELNKMLKESLKRLDVLMKKNLIFEKKHEKKTSVETVQQDITMNPIFYMEKKEEEEIGSGEIDDILEITKSIHKTIKGHSEPISKIEDVLEESSINVEESTNQLKTSSNSANYYKFVSIGGFTGN